MKSEQKRETKMKSLKPKDLMQSTNLQIVEKDTNKKKEEKKMEKIFT